MYYPMYYGFDSTYLLVLVGMLLSMWASANVKNTFSRYAGQRARSGLTAEAAARSILLDSDIHDVQIRGIQGELTDNYMPGKKILNLSESTRDSSSIAAIGVAAHECGHAIQDAQGYQPLALSRMLLPVSSFGSKASMPLIIFGLIIGFTPLIKLGIVCFMLALAFQLLTLPIEFDASRRAVAVLRERGMMSEEELRGVKKVLQAAALTYVAAAAASVLQLLRLMILARRRDND